MFSVLALLRLMVGGIGGGRSAPPAYGAATDSLRRGTEAPREALHHV